jgi:low affinity Fe/Cu permease
MKQRFHHFAVTVGQCAGSWWAFAVSFLLVLAWLVSGPFFGFSEQWQLIINTGTTVITFLMVVIIQHTQNVNDHALHVKLDELIRSVDKADNAIIGIEEKDLDVDPQDHVDRAGF